MYATPQHPEVRARVLSASARTHMPFTRSGSLTRVSRTTASTCWWVLFGYAATRQPHRPGPQLSVSRSCEHVNMVLYAPLKGFDGKKPLQVRAGARAAAAGRGH